MISKLSLKEKARSATLLLRRRPDLFIFFLLIVFLPSQLGLHFWPDWALVSGIRVDYLAPVVYLTDILVIILITYGFRFQKKYLFIVLFAIINIVFALNWKISLYKWVKILEFGLLSGWVYQNKKAVAGFIRLPLVIALTYTLVLALLQFFGGKTIGGLFYFLGERSFNIATPGVALVNLLGKNFLRPYATFPHPNALAGFSLVSFLLGVPIALPLLGLSFSGGAVIALVVVAVFGRFVKELPKQLLLSLVFVSLLLMPLGHFVTEVGFRLPENIGQRLELASIAGEAFAKSPLIGVGLGGFVPFIPQSVSAHNLWFLQPVHNLFLLVLAETGAVGLVLFVGLLLRLLKSPRSIILLGILLTGMVDHYWLTLQQTQFLFAIVIGILF